jgi:hypothetical protein
LTVLGENSEESKDKAVLSQLEQEAEYWEDELEERMQGQPLQEAITICSWEDLREKVKMSCEEEEFTTEEDESMAYHLQLFTHSQTIKLPCC